ncbi:MAG: GNAT family N-acetyltransferase [Thermotogota bacterium]
MIYKTEVNQKIKELFSSLNFITPVNSILEGNTPSKIYVDNLDDPSNAFIWNDFRYSYWVGDYNNKEFLFDLEKLLNEDLFPKAKKSSDPTMVLYPDTKEMLENTEKILKNKHPLKIKRQFFKLNKQKFNSLKYEENKDIEIKKMDEEFLYTIGKNISEDIKTTWKSLGLFLEKGIGFVLLKNDEIISSCHSCFAGKMTFEINVNTYNSENRNKGYAKIVTSKFIEYCIEKNIEPTWECWKGNIPSENLAEKLGFEKSRTHGVKLFLLNEIDEYIENAIYNRFSTKDYHKSIDYFEKAFDIMQEVDPELIYLYSGSLALSGKKEKALEYLSKAIEKGYNNLERIKNDEVFKTLHNHSNWKKIFIL